MSKQSNPVLTQTAQWEQALLQFPESNFLQSPAWARANQAFGHQVVSFYYEQPSLTLCFGIIKAARRGRYLEVSGAPLLDWTDLQSVERLFQALRQTARTHHCVFIRIRPQLLDLDTHRQLFARLGARLAPMHLHAEHTVMIDLTQSEADLLAKMRRQTRYEVRRGIKQGLVVQAFDQPIAWELFHRLQAETALRQHFIPPKYSELLAQRQAFGTQAQIYIASLSPLELPSQLSDAAYHALKQQVIALGLIVTSGQEADYFEAASTELKNRYAGAYILQWEIIKTLKQRGFTRYNLWGIAPAGAKHHRYAGVTTFKTGFGGQITEYLPAHDLVLNPWRYAKVLAIETIRKKIRHL